MTNDLLADSLVPVAAQLVGTVRDYGPEDVAAVLATVPEGRHDALAVVLAAMVDPDATPRELLAWTTAGPVKSREMEPVQPLKPAGKPNTREASAYRRAEVERLSRQGWNSSRIAKHLGITKRSVNRHQLAICAAGATPCP